MPAAHIGFLNGAAPDLDAECARYEQAIAAAGGIDLQILGIGANGHIGFNEPADGLCATPARTARLQPRARASQRERSSAATGRAYPSGAVDGDGDDSSGASEIVLIATGAEKAGVVQAMIEGHDYDRRCRRRCCRCTRG